MGAGFDLFLRSPFWKSFYENAPSERLKRHIAAWFESSGAFWLNGEDEIHYRPDGIDAGPSEPLQTFDLLYLQEYAKNGMLRAFLKRVLNAMRERDQWKTVSDAEQDR